MDWKKLIVVILACGYMTVAVWTPSVLSITDAPVPRGDVSVKASTSSQAIIICLPGYLSLNTNSYVGRNTSCFLEKVTKKLTSLDAQEIVSLEFDSMTELVLATYTYVGSQDDFKLYNVTTHFSHFVGGIPEPVFLLLLGLALMTLGAVKGKKQ